MLLYVCPKPAAHPSLIYLLQIGTDRGFERPWRDDRQPPDHPAAEEGPQQQRRRVRARGAGALPRVRPGAERPPGMRRGTPAFYRAPANSTRFLCGCGRAGPLLVTYLPDLT